MGSNPSVVPFEILHFVRDLQHSKSRKVSLPCVKIKNYRGLLNDY